MGADGAVRSGPPHGRDSRVLVYSQRRARSPIWHATQHEFEDVVVRTDDVQLLCPEQDGASDARRTGRWALDSARRRLGGARRHPPRVVPAVRPAAVTGQHDLFFAVFHHSHELLDLHRLRGWRERCARAACWLVEMWTPDLQTDRDYLELLQQFDVVFVGNPALVPGLEAMGVRDVRYLPPATDAACFSPFPAPPVRVLDCYTYGRCSPVTHGELLRLADTHGLTYLYDSTRGGQLADPTHRRLLARMMQRAQFFFAYTINDSPERRSRTGGDEVISTRYFEATAGGAVLLGSRPRAPEFDAHFDWPDVVIPVPYECRDIGEVLEDLRKQPERLALARTANVRNSLVRHDWSHRWEVVLEAVGFDPGPALVARQRGLRDLSAQVSWDRMTGEAPGRRGRDRRSA